MSTNHDVSKLDDLITTTIDSVNGYEHSAEKAEAARYSSLFAELAAERRQVVSALQAESRRLGGTPNDFGSAAAALHRRIEDLRRAFGGGDAAIVKEVERGEDYLKEEYERVLKDDHIAAETLAVVRRCYESVVRGHDKASALKHEIEAAS
jgi:uncharacterized protein (TIGR02284 family)